MLERNASRVLVVYAYPSRIRQLVPAINRANLQGRIIFIFPECTGFHGLRAALSNMVGSIKIDMNDIPDPSYAEFLDQLTPWTLPQDPWLKAAWEGKFTCDYNDNSSSPNCYDHKGITESPDFTAISPISSRYIDLIYVLAAALDEYIRTKCPEAVGNKSALRACVKPHELNTFINKVSIKRPGRTIRLVVKYVPLHAANWFPV